MTIYLCRICGQSISTEHCNFCDNKHPVCPNCGLCIMFDRAH